MKQIMDQLEFDFGNHRRHPRFAEVPDANVEEQRVSGDCYCHICHIQFRYHSRVSNILSFDGHPFLHLHCDGTLMKL